MDWSFTTTTDYSAAPLTVAIGGIRRDDPRGPEHAGERGGDSGVERVDFEGFGLTITGNFGFQENAGGIEAAANHVTALLGAGPAECRGDGQDIGPAAEQRRDEGVGGLQANSARCSSDAAGFASASATKRFGGLEHDDDGLQRGSADGGDQGDQRDDPHAAPNTQSVAVTGLSVSISSFVTITGNFGFEENSGGIEAAANGVTALLSAGPASVGVTGGTLALLLNNDGTKVLEASRARLLVQRGGLRQRERDERAGGLEHDDDGLQQRGSADGDDRGDQRDDPRGSRHAKRGGDGS